MHNWYTEFARRFYLSPLQVRYIFRKEFKDILVNNKTVVDSHELNERYNCCAYILENGKAKFYTGDKAREFKKLFIQTEPRNVKNTKEIKGSIAYSGKARGIVKIVNSTADLKKFNDGDILVSFSTNPSLVPAMNKAAAIITNTGGVTCHAAIVSRELKIPCIIGTKIATRALKDGDKVEVDATKGIIKKLD